MDLGNLIDGLTRIKIPNDELIQLTIDELIENWHRQDRYIDAIEKHLNSIINSGEYISVKESEEKLKQQQLEATRRENILMMRLASKEQEVQDYINQIQELKQSQIPSSANLQNTYLDPAVNLLFDKMKKEVDSAKSRVLEMQDELAAWKFTPDSNTGKRLMAKCKLLYQENEELGKMISSGRVAKLEAELALLKNFSQEMKKNQSEIDEFLLEIDEDVEGMQSTIYYLQQQLKDSNAKIESLERDIQLLEQVNLDKESKTELKGQGDHQGGHQVDQQAERQTGQRQSEQRAGDQHAESQGGQDVGGPQAGPSVGGSKEGQEEEFQSDEHYLIQESYFSIELVDEEEVTEVMKEERIEKELSDLIYKVEFPDDIDMI